ncbi:g11883 [Coccomyxa elongata]
MMQSNAAVWSALEEAYSGSEDELQLAALESDTYESLANEYSPQGRPGRDQSSDSTGPDTSFTLERGADSLVFIREPGQEKIRISRALRILGDIRSTLEQRNASELDANCTISAGTALPASLERKTGEVSQQMMGLAVQDGTQQPDNVILLPQPAPSTASETPAGTCHADLHDRPTASRTQTFSEQISAASVPAQSEHPSPQQTPRVGLSAILDTAPDQPRMLSNLPALSSQQAGPSQHGNGLLWMGINMLTTDDVSARALAAAAAHPDAAEAQHSSGGAFSLSSDLSPESEDNSLAHVNRDNPAGVVIEGPTSAPDFGRTPLRRVPSGLTAQLRGKGPLGGRGLRPDAEDDRFGAFWPEAGSVRRVIRQKEFLVEEEDAGEFEDASDKLFGEMSLSSGSHSGTDAASTSGMHGDAPAGMHDVGSSSSREHVPLTDVGNSEERSMYEAAEDTQPSALTSEAAEGMVPSIASVISGVTAAELSRGAEQVMDSTSTPNEDITTKALETTDQRMTQDAKHSEKACAGMGKLNTEAVGSATEAFEQQDAADMVPSGAVQDEDILYELEKTVQQLTSSCTPPASQQRQIELTTPSPDRSCWSPTLGPMLEETVGSLFAATPVKKLSGEDDV